MTRSGWYIFICIILSSAKCYGVEVALPFGAATGLDRIQLGRSPPRAQVRLPFSDFRPPQIPVLSELLNRPLYRINGASEAGPRIIHTKRSESALMRSSGPPARPLSVINLPMADFALPFSRVTETRQELPLFARERLGHLAAGSRSGNIDDITNRQTRVGTASKEVLLPFSNLNSLPLGPNTPLSAAIPGASLLRSLQKDSFSESLSADAPHAPGFQIDSLIVEAAHALKAPNAININSFSLPYSFLNNPLSFFNLPLSYLNMPFGSNNLPLGHINLPFGFFNIPFFEMIQTLGVPPIPAMDFDSLRNAKGPLDKAAGAKFRETDEQVDPGSVTVESGGLEVLEKELGRFFHAIEVARIGAANISEEEAADAGTPRAQIRLVNRAIAGAVEPVSVVEQKETMNVPNAARPDVVSIPEPDERSKEVFGRFSRVLRDAVPSIPQLGGLVGLENSLFTTPFSLFNLPLGFMDLPTGFINLPLSHFNLPLAHLTLPFASMALPSNDIATPELDQTVLNANVELADIPPSLLTVLNPENPLQSYLNLPLSELNLPLAVMDMPFAIFDLPFAFLNLPIAHLNNPFTHLHLPFEVSTLPLSEVGLPFESFLHFPFEGF